MKVAVVRDTALLRWPKRQTNEHLPPYFSGTAGHNAGHTDCVSLPSSAQNVRVCVPSTDEPIEESAQESHAAISGCCNTQSLCLAVIST